jgi:hypothetical protein
MAMGWDVRAEPSPNTIWRDFMNMNIFVLYLGKVFVGRLGLKETFTGQ